MTLRENIRRAVRTPCHADFSKLFGFAPKPRRQVRWAGLVTDAETLGVNRIHLYLVLKGDRTSHRLLARYHQLKGTR
jgi:hypothetical protein